MNELEKLRIVLPHWIEHNRSHGREFATWAETLSASGESEIANLLQKAAASLQEADVSLVDALARTDGGDESHHHHHHHHHEQ